LSEATRTQYETLAELRRTDEKILRLKRGLEEVPKDLAKLDQTLTDRRKSFDTAKSALEAIEKKLRSLELDIKERDAGIEKAASKMMEVKTNQEYQAALKENEERKNEKTKVEEEVLKLVTEAEAARKTMKEQEAEFKAFEATVNLDKSRLQEDAARMKGLLDEQIQRRELSTSKLDASVASVYARVASSGAIAVAVCDNYVCQGCRTKVRPQLYNEILGLKAVHRCPSCGRLLIGANHDSAAASSA
jgi:predicted  nucleic acid-binding Zn-ribbon protein